MQVGVEIFRKKKRRVKFEITHAKKRGGVVGRSIFHIRGVQSIGWRPVTAVTTKKYPWSVLSSIILRISIGIYALGKRKRKRTEEGCSTTRIRTAVKPRPWRGNLRSIML